MRRWFSIAATALLAVALLPQTQAQELAKRLILKDGSYQAVTKWEIKGDRVRYYSAERNDWEEMPNSLVDWNATNKYNQAREAGAPPPEIQQQVDQEFKADTADEAPTPQAAPGLNLPDFEGVFVLDSYQGQPQLLELQQDAGDLNKNIKRNVLTSAINPLASAKQSIELPGEHAPVQIHQGQPAIFINMAPDQSDATLQQKTQEAEQATQAKDTKKEKKGHEAEKAADAGAAQPYRLVRLEPKKGRRVLGNLKIAVYGKVSQEQKFVPSSFERLTGNWLKVTPSAELQPGEYAVVEMLSPKEMNLYVWDFGVNPNAPANPLAWKPAAPAPKPANSQPPPLQTRPKN
ncbi:MAG TPA: hypothetical protein VL155_16875 [Terriglobales bacterium]|jgi:hypothetical protein|nr:hypothetical protein [Terriglobales bacterium]